MGGFKNFLEILRILRDMLPPNDDLPLFVHEAKKKLNALGMEYKKIHVQMTTSFIRRV